MRSKIGLTFGLLTLVLLIGTGAAVSRLVSQRIESDISAAMLRAARLVAFTFTRELHERQQDLMGLAGLLDAPSAIRTPEDRARETRMLDDFAQRYGLDSVLLLDAEGRVQLAAGPAQDAASRAPRPWLSAALTTPHFEDRTGSEGQAQTAPSPMLLTVPVLGANGPQGVLAATLAAPWIDRLRERLKLLVPPDQHAGLEVFVLGHDGQLRAAHNAAAMPPADAGAMRSGQCARTPPEAEGIHYVSCAVTSEAYRDFPNPEWRVVIRLPEHLAFAAADNLEARIAWIGLLAATLFGVVGWLLADRISEPIKAISRAADRIASGDRQVDLPITGRNEIALLARSLSSLVTRLRQDEAALLRTNQLLEARVAERTLELEKAVAELQDANTDLDRFASMVSHDLLAPVRAMRTFSELLMMDYGDTLAPEAQRLLKRIDQAGLDMSNLVNALHALSKLGKKPLHVTQTDMNQVVRECIQAHLPAWDEKTIHMDPLEPAQCDPAMIRIVFDNLIGNAVKYSQRTAEPSIVLGGQRQGDEQVYWVSDNGAGFDPQYAHRLFQIFQRLHSARDYPGTGVGLATVAKIVSRHGGRVWAEGQPLEGATFYFSLPVAKQPEKPGDVWPESMLEAPSAAPGGVNPASA